MRVDSDAHVDESETTWNYLAPEDEAYRPTSSRPSIERYVDANDLAWQVDGKEFRRAVRDPQRTGVTADAGQLEDIETRLRHMDELTIDVQILYPTLFLRSRFQGGVELERALVRAYNRWISDRTSESGGRLRWIAVLPLLDIDTSLEEMDWAKEHGACGIFKRGVECGDRPASDPYFHPIYGRAADLGLPMCVHTGSEYAGALTPRALTAVRAFYPLVNMGVMEAFPDLRVGFIEAGASWVPFVLSMLASEDRTHRLRSVDPNSLVEIDRELFRRCRLYVACQSQDDLPYLLQYGLEDQLLVGTDYTHQDNAAELLAMRNIDSKAESGQISNTTARKILDDNPRAFYGL